MAVVIRMMRAGGKKRPFYRVVVADSRRQRDGRFIEILGYYDPMARPFAFKVDEGKVQGWIAQGVQPSTQVASLLRRHGILAARPRRAAKPAAAAETTGPAKRRRPRKVTPRKTRNQAARAKKKAHPRQRKPKKQ